MSKTTHKHTTYIPNGCIIILLTAHCSNHMCAMTICFIFHIICPRIVISNLSMIEIHIRIESICYGVIRIVEIGWFDVQTTISYTYDNIFTLWKWRNNQIFKSFTLITTLVVLVNFNERIWRLCLSKKTPLNPSRNSPFPITSRLRSFNWPTNYIENSTANT